MRLVSKRNKRINLKTFRFLKLQEAFAKGWLKPGMNVLVDKTKQFVNNVVSTSTVEEPWRAITFQTGLVFTACADVVAQEGLKHCLADLRKDVPWVERLDMTNPPAKDVSLAEGQILNVKNGDVDAEDDFQREMFLWVTMTHKMKCPHTECFSHGETHDLRLLDATIEILTSSYFYTHKKKII